MSRKYIWEMIERRALGGAVQLFANTLLILGVLTLILGCIKSDHVQSDMIANMLSAVSAGASTALYIVRFWACTADSQFQSSVSRRVRFMFRPGSILDVAVVLPFYIACFGVSLPPSTGTAADVVDVAAGIISIISGGSRCA